MNDEIKQYQEEIANLRREVERLKDEMIRLVGRKQDAIGMSPVDYRLMVTRDMK